uniref:Uncharacterized protein n=1 Tax=Wuchereria bancrofti TaxID=6293 RepID=A0AAF5PJT1_WUCBA
MKNLLVLFTGEIKVQSFKIPKM